MSVALVLQLLGLACVHHGLAGAAGDLGLYVERDEKKKNLS